MRIKVFLVLLSFFAADATAESLLERLGKATDTLAAPTLEALAEARSKWESSGFENYAVVISNECLCPNPTHIGPIVIHVRDGKLRHAVYLGQPRNGYAQGQAVRGRTPLRVTIDGLFERIEKQIKIGNGPYLKLKYDAKNGYPTHFEYADPARSGEQFKILLKDFKLL
jgi:hypothetical protein